MIVGVCRFALEFVAVAIGLPCVFVGLSTLFGVEFMDAGPTENVRMGLICLVLGFVFLIPGAISFKMRGAIPPRGRKSD
jgi:hypothetical protein